MEEFSGSIEDKIRLMAEKIFYYEVIELQRGFIAKYIMGYRIKSNRAQQKDMGEEREQEREQSCLTQDLRNWKMKLAAEI